MPKIEKLLRNDCLIKLPEYTEKETRTLKSGLYVSALQEKQRFNPTCGVVVKVANDEQIVRVGDTVFFANHIWLNSKTRAFGSDDERFKGMYVGHRSFALKEEDGYYMIIPENQLIFIKRGDELIPLNGHVIAVPHENDVTVEDVPMGGVFGKVNARKQGSLLIVDLQEEKYKINMAVVFSAPEGSDLKKGDVVHTLKHCDLFVENELNEPILPDKYFFIELEDILAKRT